MCDSIRSNREREGGKQKKKRLLIVNVSRNVETKISRENRSRHLSYCSEDNSKKQRVSSQKEKCSNFKQRDSDNYFSFVGFSLGLTLSTTRPVVESTTSSTRVLQKKHSLLVIKCVLIHDKHA